MQKVMDSFYGLMMSQQFDFLEYFLSGSGPKNPEREVVELYEETKKLPEKEQRVIADKVRGWAFALTREEMFIGARDERIRRNNAKKE